MLRAFKEQLNSMAVENGVAFARQIKKRLKVKKSQPYISKSMGLIMIMPELIAQTRLWMEDDRVPPEIKRLNGYLLTYLYHPDDLISDKDHGLLGYLDDAYFVGTVYRETAVYVSRASEAIKQLPRMMEMVRKVIPSEADKIDRLVQELKQGKRRIFEELISQKN